MFYCTSPVAAAANEGNMTNLAAEKTRDVTRRIALAFVAYSMHRTAAGNVEGREKFMA